MTAGILYGIVGIGDYVMTIKLYDENGKYLPLKSGQYKDNHAEASGHIGDTDSRIANQIWTSVWTRDDYGYLDHYTVPSREPH